MSQLFKTAACFTDIHYGLKQNSRLHLDDCARYIDWFITTPTMLLSTIIFMEYLKNEKTFTLKEFMIDHRGTIGLIFSSNALMLIFGYLGEIGKMNKTKSVIYGFIPFIVSVYEYICISL